MHHESIASPPTRSMEAIDALYHQTLHHLTLSTGHGLDVPCTTIDTLLTMEMIRLARTGGPIRGMPGWHLFVLPIPDAEGRTQRGGGFFECASQPGQSQMPAIQALACWSEDCQPYAWRFAKEMYEMMRAIPGGQRMPPAPALPPPLPWLCVIFTPFIEQVRPADLRRFGQVEQAVTLAMMMNDLA